MESSPSHLVRRQGYQSQDLNSGTIVDYWGYAARVLPCANDPGTCEYFEAVYGGHERGMLYTGILWATIGGILLIWAVGRHVWSRQRASEVLKGTKDVPASEKSRTKAEASAWGRLGRAAGATGRAILLPETLRMVFGRTTRLQVLILAILTGYVALWSFVGITYKMWTTPVKGYDNLYQTRSGLGAWSDRVGVLAYALTPLSVLLASRESILSQLTGVPYQSFNFLHRWLGYIIVVQSVLHTIGWTIIEVHFYQPQPKVADKWIKQLYMIWGCVAVILIFMLSLLATPWGIRMTGYEVFRKSHYILAMVYVGACWGHWKPLKIFMIPSLAIWLFDRAARLVRSWVVHYQYLPNGSLGFQAAQGSVTRFPDAENGDMVRLEYSFAQEPWSPGQHFYLCFPQSSVWQSHPFTPLNLATEVNGTVNSTYVFRARGGETRKIAELAVRHARAANDHSPTIATPVIMQGPYGEDLVAHLTPDVNVLCIAGGTGIVYVLPVLLWLVGQPAYADRKITLVWAVRRARDVDWVQPELQAIRNATQSHGINVAVHVTRETASATAEASNHAPNEKNPQNTSCASGSASSHSSSSGHPKIATVVDAFLNATVRGRTEVFASGPGAMLSDLREAVAAQSSGVQVWRGNERFDIALKCDDRLE